VFEKFCHANPYYDFFTMLMNNIFFFLSMHTCFLIIGISISISIGYDFFMFLPIIVHSGMSL